MDVERFDRHGFFGPGRVLEPDECRSLLLHLGGEPAPRDWAKGRAATSRLLYEVATRPAILDPVVEILGPDVVLWGASIATRAPGDVHPPHVDIETADRAARSITAWIGLENTTRDSAVWLIAGSHRLDATIQEVAHREGRRRGEVDRDGVLGWATHLDPASALSIPDMSDGEAIWFDGRLWHGSDNRSGLTRTALLLQFATADTAIRIPDLAHLDWPFRLIAEPRPPCIVVAGDSHGDTNRIVPPPPPLRSTTDAISTWIHELDLPLAQDSETGFRPHHIFDGSTSNTALLSTHASILDGGHSPHEPHVHGEEELLVVLDGKGELVVGPEGERRVVAAHPGVLAYYPAGYPHTIRGVGDAPIQYLMFKWSGATTAGPGWLAPVVHDLRDVTTSGEDGVGHAFLFHGATTHLYRLGCHVTDLEVGAGYEAHVDAHDVAILLLEGSVDTLGEVVEAPAVVFTSGGWPHGIRNVGAVTARYIVFEFHGPGPRMEPPTGPGVRLEGARQALDEPVVVADGRPTAPRRAWAAVWSGGGRLLRPFPRVKRLLRRALGPMSPWR